MNKLQLLEMIKDIPDDHEIAFMQEDEREHHEHFEMYLDTTVDYGNKGYTEISFRWTRIIETP